MEYIVVVNWGKFQQYKDRNPPWIKLHTSLLDDYEFQRLPGDAKWQLLLLWLVAARQDNRIPDDREWLASFFHVDPNELKIDLLVDRGWLEVWAGTKEAPEYEQDERMETWASRYVSDQTRKELLDKAAHKCQECGSREKLEVDHIVPISRGGDGKIENLRILCRSCNRKKRTRWAATQQASTQEATQLPSPSTTQAESESDPHERDPHKTSQFAEQF